MRNFVLTLSVAVLPLCAQAPDQARGTVDGKPVNQAQLEALINLVPEQQRGAIAGNQEELLRYYGFVTRMAEMAEKQKLGELSPYKEQLELGRKTVLAVAEMSEFGKNLGISNADVEKYYDEHKDAFTTANVTVAQVPIPSDKEAAAAKAKAESLWQQVKAGGDFSAMAKQYPVEGDFKSFKKSDPIPAEIKDAVFALKPGEVARPVARPNAVFLIRLDSLVVKPLQDARGDVLKTLQDAKFQGWMDGVRKSVVIGK
ncbi:MAG TPA: peptidylprolyl isomerase [Candidatus Acidoferrales bacterium]|nr:peptidylprolyl isomerase [Candidatus Acidoferrales bacterium]